MKKRRNVWKWTFLTGGIVAILCAPLYFIAIGGFQSPTEVFHRPPYLFPPRPTLIYYKDAYSTLLPYLKNSFIIALGVTLFTLIIAVPGAFALAKFDFFLDTSIVALFAFIQILPTTAVIIPLFLLFMKLHLINNYLGVILGISVLLIPFAVIVLRSYFMSIPIGLIEAAVIDGAGYFKILTNIVLPLSIPGIATVATLTFLLAWGNFLVPLAFLKEKTLQPASVGLFLFIGQHGVQWNKLMAGSLIYTIPPLVIALLGGKFIVAGLTAGAFKE